MLRLPLDLVIDHGFMMMVGLFDNLALGLYMNNAIACLSLVDKTIKAVARAFVCHDSVPRNLQCFVSGHATPSVIRSVAKVSANVDLK